MEPTTPNEQHHVNSMLSPQRIVVIRKMISPTPNTAPIQARLMTTHCIAFTGTLSSAFALQGHRDHSTVTTYTPQSPTVTCLSVILTCRRLTLHSMSIVSKSRNTTSASLHNQDGVRGRRRSSGPSDESEREPFVFGLGTDSEFTQLPGNRSSAGRVLKT
jgi:hypothetical protein